MRERRRKRVKEREKKREIGIGMFKREREGWLKGREIGRKRERYIEREGYIYINIYIEKENKK